jgi:pantetheine-phosphate adenylyltransferase
MSAKAVFAGTFDPVTLGHLDLVRRGRGLFDEVIVSVAREGRDTMFSAEERVALFCEAIGDVDGVSVEAFDGLVVEQARRHGARALLRGMRGMGDWDHEMQMAVANRSLEPDLETIFLPPSAGMSMVSASLVREVVRMGGDVAAWVPPCVVEALGRWEA